MRFKRVAHILSHMTINILIMHSPTCRSRANISFNADETPALRVSCVTNAKWALLSVFLEESDYLEHK